MNNLTSSLEDYLETIYVLQEGGNDVRITDIAREMGLSKPSVNRAVNTLKTELLVEQKRYGKISLTPSGKEAGNEIYIRHNILKRFFSEILGVSSENAEADACKSEHVLSKETIKKIMLYTNNYTS